MRIPHPSYRTIVALLAFLASVAPTAGRAQSGIVEEARTFMDAYARDLLAGNREAIVARYDRRGGYLLGNGSKTFMPLDSIRAVYTGRWQPPRSFEWRDLSFEPAGPDAVVVTGLFVWGGGRPGAPPATFSYTGLLVRRDGALRIRIEDESSDPRSMRPPPPPCPPDSARG